LCVFLDFDLLGIETLFPDVGTLAVLEESEAVLEELSLTLNSRAALLDAVTNWEALLANFNQVQSENKDSQRLQNHNELLLESGKGDSKADRLNPQHV
jgi:hypothetical protein